MAGTSFSNTYPAGVTLTQADDPATIASSATILSVAGPALYGGAGTQWHIVNQGRVQSTGTAGVGVSLASSGTVTNSAGGSIGGYVGVQLDSGSVTNAEGGQISGLFEGVVMGAGPNQGGTVANSGAIVVSSGSAGAGVKLLGPGVILNAASGVIRGAALGVVAYDDATIVNRGYIGGASYAIEQTNPAAANRVEMAPGAGFAGIVAGGALAAPDAALGTLELLAGDQAGSLTGFGTTFQGFASVRLDAGADWSLAGQVSAGQSVVFAGGGTLTLATPASMAGTLAGFTYGDTLDLHGVTGVASATVNPAGVLVLAGAGPAVSLQLDAASASALRGVLRFSASGDDTVLVACFATGTRIATETGELPVEALAVGTRLRTRFGGVQPVIWVGHRRTDCRRHPHPQDVQPVRVQAGAFGAGRPARDLWLSPDHAVFIGAALIPVRYLINGRSIAPCDVDCVTYWHVELPRHDVLLAEGLPCESYLDTGNRHAFADSGAATMLHPDFALRVWQAQGCARLLRHGRAVIRARLNLLDRAAALGHRLTDDPGVMLLAGERRLALLGEGRRRRALGASGRVRLNSRVWTPAHTRAGEQDTRRLGVAVANITLDGVPLALDDARLTTGWHPPEAKWRWTDGDGVIETGRGGNLAFTIAMTGTYWRDETAAERRAV